MQLIKKGIHFLNKNLVCMHAQRQNMEHGFIQTIFSILNIFLFVIYSENVYI